MSFSLALLICAFSFLTSILSGVLGMAGGIILMGLLAWMLPVQQAMVIHAVAQFFANASRAFLHRRHIYYRTLPFYFAGLAAVFCAFTLVSFVTSTMTVFLLMGATPYLTMALPKNMKLNFTRPLDAFMCGALSTGFQLTAGTVGGILDVFFQNRALTRHETVSTKAFVQSISHTAKFIYFSMIVSTLSDTFRDIPLWLCLAVIPIAMAGTNLGKLILEKLTDQHFYRATQGILLVIGAVYLVKAFLLWNGGQ